MQVSVIDPTSRKVLKVSEVDEDDLADFVSSMDDLGLECEYDEDDLADYGTPRMRAFTPSIKAFKMTSLKFTKDESTTPKMPKMPKISFRPRD